MKKNRRRIIIAAAGILAAVIVICLVLPGSKSPAVESARKEGRTKATETVTTETGTKQTEPEKERRTVVPDNKPPAMQVESDSFSFKQKTSNDCIILRVDDERRKCYEQVYR